MRHVDAIADGAPAAQEQAEIFPKASEIGGEVVLNVRPPKNLVVLSDVTKEIARIYRMGLRGQIPLSASSKLIFQLNILGKSMIAEHTLAQLEDAYREAFRGLTIMPPTEAAQRKVNGSKRANGANGSNGASKGK